VGHGLIAKARDEERKWRLRGEVSEGGRGLGGAEGMQGTGQDLAEAGRVGIGEDLAGDQLGQGNMGFTRVDGGRGLGVFQEQGSLVTTGCDGLQDGFAGLGDILVLPEGLPVQGMEHARDKDDIDGLTTSAQVAGVAAGTQGGLEVFVGLDD